MIGVTAGVLIITWMSLSPIYFTSGAILAFKSPFHTNLTIVFGTTVIFLVGFLISHIITKKK
jgi:SSS family solute:Na+ symporter